VRNSSRNAIAFEQLSECGQPGRRARLSSRRFDKDSAHETHERREWKRAISKNFQARAGKEGSQWVVMVRRPEDLGGLVDDTQWMASLPNVTGAAWTDDYSNVLGALVFTK
jgi:hypothetical protein